MFTIPPARYILPNLFTLSATFCGFAAIWLGSQAESGAQFYAAASLIAFAVFLDGFDGRVARMVNAETKMGVQLDSLSDFLTFGVAPATLAYAWGLKPFGVVGLLVAFVFAAGAMLRLARFNVEAEEVGGTGPSRYFRGLPAPMAGMTVSLLIGIHGGVLHRDSLGVTAQPSLAVLVVLLALLMVSNVPFRTFKDLRPTGRNRLLVASFVALLAVISIVADPLVGLAAGLACYFTINLTGGLLSAARARNGVQGGAAVVDDGDDDEDVFAG
jgi:CDP-diacylglycerol--serine O-phosphatidyltransferase